MSRVVRAVVTLLLAGAAMAATSAMAQTLDDRPTNKDRLDTVIGTVTGNPLAKADADMKHVLDALADLKPRPIEGDLSAADLRGLPPTTIITAEIDPLRDDGLRLAEKLRQASVPVEAHDYEGVTHEFFGMANVVSDAREAQAMAATDLRNAFERGAAGPKRGGTSD